MSKPSELLERTVKRCPYSPGSGAWMTWISREMDKTKDLDEKLIDHRRKVEDEKRRHANQLAALNKLLEELQQYCPHENMQRGTAECDPVCAACGWSAS